MACDCALCSRFELGSMEIQGGQATVLRARDLLSETYVAIKLIPIAGDALLQKGIWEREVRSLKRLSSSGIVRYVASGNAKCKSAFFVATEWLEISLQDRLDRGERIASRDEWQRFAGALLRALSVAHSQNIQHRDLKPGNIMFRSNLTDDWQPVLIDFGAAKNSLDEDIDEGVTVSEFHTPLYSPLNHHQKTPVERDLFAAAAVLSVVVMAKQPTTRLQLMEHFGDLNESGPVSGYFYRVLEKALQPASTNFFNSVNQFVDELEKARTSEIEARFADRKSAINFVVTLSAREAAGRYLEESSESAIDLLRTSISGAFWISFAEDGLLKGSPTDFNLLFDGFEAVCAVNNGRGTSAPFVIKTVRKLKDVQFERLVHGLDELSIYLRPNFHETEKSSPSHTEQTLRIFDELFHKQKRSLQKAGNQKEPGDFVRKAKSIIEARKILLLDGVPELDFELVDSDATFATVRVDTNFEIPDSSAWQLQDSKLRNVFFTLSGSTEDNLFLKSSRPVDQWPSKGRLIPHLGLNETAFKRQLDALEDIEKGRMIFPNLTAVLENPESVREFSIASGPQVSGLDDSKNNALLSAISSKDVFLLEGPPGTGKTSYITALLERYLERNPADRVLLVSQTNVAIDNVLERLPENLIGSTVRVSREDSSIVSKGAEGFVIDNKLRIWRKQVEEESQSYFGQSEIAQTETVVQAEKLAALQKLRHLLLAAESFQSQVNQKMTTLSAAIMNIDLDELPENLGITEKVKATREVLAKLNVDSRVLSTSSSAFVDHAIEELLESNPNLVKERDLLNLHAMWLAKFGSDPHIREALIERSKIVAGTCVGFVRDKTVRSMDFDLCIIDESSRATTNELLVPISRSRRVVIIGDTRQLPPNDEDLLSRTDILEGLGLQPADIESTIFAEFSKHLPSTHKAMLDTQYRMSPEIGKLVSVCFYENALKTHDDESSSNIRAALGPEVLWLDTSEMASKSPEQRTSSGSIRNKLEYTIIQKYLTRILTPQLESSALDGRVLEVLVIAPYRAQTNFLRSSLQGETLGGRVKIRVETLDAVQGLEADISILSVTRSNAKGRMGFIGSPYWRRINVALSRARHKLVIVGDSSTVLRSGQSVATKGLHSVFAFMQSNPDMSKILQVSE